jgi:hypothetical protein
MCLFIICLFCFPVLHRHSFLPLIPKCIQWNVAGWVGLWETGTCQMSAQRNFSKVVTQANVAVVLHRSLTRNKLFLGEKVQSTREEFKLQTSIFCLTDLLSFRCQPSFCYPYIIRCRQRQAQLTASSLYSH